MSFTVLLITWAIVNVSFGVGCSFLAGRWGRDPYAWFFLGLAVGPIAFIVLLANRWNDQRRERPVLAGPGSRAGATSSVLVAVDGSEHSNRAVQHVIDELGPEEGEVLVVGVLHLERADALDTGQDSLRRRDLEEEIERRVGTACDTLRAAGVSARSIVRFGEPGTEILKQAAESNCARIVLGRRGTGSPTKALLGSVSDKVSREASCPVTVVD